MSKILMPPKAAWPSFPLISLGGWIVAATTVATIAFYLFAELNGLDPKGRLAVCIALAASPIPIIVIRYLGSLIFAMAQRAWYYPTLYRMLEARITTSETIEKQLAESIQDRPRYEILKVHWFSVQEEIYLLIRRKGGTQPRVGARFLAIDVESGRLMAVSEMMEIRSEGYYAKVIYQIDPVWLGRLRQFDRPELPPPPRMAAVLSRKREDI